VSTYALVSLAMIVQNPVNSSPILSLRVRLKTVLRRNHTSDCRLDRDWQL